MKYNREQKLAEYGNGTYAKIILDSIGPDGTRLTTMELRFHRYILAELNTHRDLSRNAASSRALPFKKTLAAVRDDPALPIDWLMEQSGMQAGVPIEEPYLRIAKQIWIEARDKAWEYVNLLISGPKLHKQWANRLIEPFMWTTDIITFSRPDNLFNQRCHKDAQPEFKALADCMQMGYYANDPEPIGFGNLHLPYIRAEDWDDMRQWLKSPMLAGHPWQLEQNGPTAKSVSDVVKWVSTARCARVSYLNHDGVRAIQSDIDMYHTRLLRGGHWSPFEHIAWPCEHVDILREINAGIQHDSKMYRDEFVDDASSIKAICTKTGNFGHGWHQFRKEFPNENRTKFIPNLQELGPFLLGRGAK
jgi:thymidylate synthase ThyX